MRANIPPSPPERKDPPQRPITELTGIYLQAMQDISARLMEALPAEDSLWQTLTQAESLLMEAQLMGSSLHDVFGNGGIAAFCQSIVDEYNQNRAGEKRDTPAARDRSLRTSRKDPEPRGGINRRRKRQVTASLIVAFSLLFVFLTVWYTGLLSYWVKGSAYYLDELYHFSSTITPLAEEPIGVTLPMTPQTGIGQVLYADTKGHTITLQELTFSERLYEVTDTDGESDESESTAVYRKNIIWCIRLRYPVDVKYMDVTYIEPGTTGTATLTLPSGETVTTSISSYSSGADGRGYEYVMLEVMDIPEDTDITGGSLTIILDPPKLVEWKRIGTGKR